VKCYPFAMVKMGVQARIRFNGKEYSGPDELPPEVRAAFEKAMADGKVREKPVINGLEFTDANQMPESARKLYDDIMGVIENNGEVTLPTSRRFEPVLTKRQVQAVILVVGMLFGLTVLALFKR